MLAVILGIVCLMLLVLIGALFVSKYRLYVNFKLYVLNVLADYCNVDNNSEEWNRYNKDTVNELYEKVKNNEVSLPNLVVVLDALRNSTFEKSETLRTEVINSHKNFWLYPAEPITFKKVLKFGLFGVNKGL